MENQIEQKIITFWCHRCRTDWKLLATKHYKNAVLGEVWMAFCPDCRAQMVRPINQPEIDPYFRKSRKVHHDLRKYAKDLIQFGDPSFDVLYPHIKAENEEKRDRAERELWKKHNEKNRNLHNIL